MLYTSWVHISLVDAGRDTVEKHLITLGFQNKNGVFIDQHSREAKFVDAKSLFLRVPRADLIDEQEQMEFIAGSCGLDIDFSV